MPPVSQPPCKASGDCSNFKVVVSWTIPAAARSGVFLAKMRSLRKRGGFAFALFIVRADDLRGDIMLQTSDTTWHAYNQHSGEAQD